MIDYNKFLFHSSLQYSPIISTGNATATSSAVMTLATGLTPTAEFQVFFEATIAGETYISRFNGAWITPSGELKVNAVNGDKYYWRVYGGY